MNQRVLLVNNSGKHCMLWLLGNSQCAWVYYSLRSPRERKEVCLLCLNEPFSPHTLNNKTLSWGQPLKLMSHRTYVKEMGFSIIFPELPRNTLYFAPRLVTIPLFGCFWICSSDVIILKSSEEVKTLKNLSRLPTWTILFYTYLSKMLVTFRSMICCSKRRFSWWTLKRNTQPFTFSSDVNSLSWISHYIESMKRWMDF